MSLETHRPILMKVLDKRDADKILNDEQIKEYIKLGFLCIMQTYDTFGYKAGTYIRVKPSIRQELLDLHTALRYYLENSLQEVMKIEELIAWLQR